MSEEGRLSDKVTFHWRSKGKMEINFADKPVKRILGRAAIETQKASNITFA